MHNAKQQQNKIKILVQEFFCKYDTRIIQVNINKIKCCGKMLLFIILAGEDITKILQRSISIGKRNGSSNKYLSRDFLLSLRYSAQSMQLNEIERGSRISFICPIRSVIPPPRSLFLFPPIDEVQRRRERCQLLAAKNASGKYSADSQCNCGTAKRLESSKRRKTRRCFLWVYVTPRVAPI